MTRQARRLGSRIKWFTDSSDKPIGEANSVNDGPQRKATEENESLKCAQGILCGPHSTRRIWRSDAGNTEMAEAIAGRTSRGIPYVCHDNDKEIEIFFRCGEKDRSM